MSCINQLFIVAILLQVLWSYAQTTPEQIHIALAGPQSMSVTWFTPETTLKSQCQYGTESDKLNLVARGTQRTYHREFGFHHVTELPNLSHSTKYFYSCGDGTTMSEVFSFTSAPSNEKSSKPVSIAIFGDMGYGDSSMRPMGLFGHIIFTVREWSATYSRNLLEQWKDKNEIDMVWHIGDIGYADDATFYSVDAMRNFQYETIQNAYMNWLQSLTTALPYHVTVGNHEAECWDPECILNPKTIGLPLSNFSAYNTRWNMPSKQSNGVANMWYSYDYGAIHFTSIDTETDFDGSRLENRGPIFPCGHFASDGVFTAWLEADLAAAAANPAIQWIIVGGHRNMNDLPSTIQSLFSKYGVALYVGGHIHSYARYPPVQGVTQILIGGPGCDDMQYSTDNPTTEDGHRIPTPLHPTTNCTEWAMVQNAMNKSPFKIEKDKEKDWLHVCEGLSTSTSAITTSSEEDNSSYFTNAYSIGKMTIADNGYGDTLLWELYSSVDGSVLDTVTIVNPRKKQV